MVNVTEKAASELKRIGESEELGPDKRLRLAPVSPRTLGLVVGESKEGDQVVEHEGAEVLVIGQEISESLDGSTIDLRETEEGPQFAIMPPANE